MIVLCYAKNLKMLKTPGSSRPAQMSRADLKQYFSLIYWVLLVQSPVQLLCNELGPVGTEPSSVTLQ